MKITEIPEAAFYDKPIEVPTKVVVVHDWPEFYKLIKTKGFAVIECNEQDLRITNAGGQECPTVKAFNSWCRANFKQHAKTKRISGNRWVVCL